MELDQSAPVSTEVAAPSAPTEAPKESAAPTTPPTAQEVAERALNADSNPTATPQAAAPQELAIPEYKPDFKYKVFREERELDPRVQALIKTKEDEEYFKKVYSAADGVEVFKQTAQEAKQQSARVMATVNEVIKAADLGDYGSVLRHAGVDLSDVKKVVLGLGFKPEDVIKVAYEMATLTPEAKAYQDRQIQLERQNKETQMTAAQYQARIEQMETQARAQELSHAITQPGVAHIAQAYDQTNGQGAFWEEVKNYGELVFYRTKQDISVAQAVDAVTKRLGAMMPQQAAPQMAAPQFAQGNTSPQATKDQDQLPVIPTVGNASSQAPAKRAIRSVADLQREYDSLT